MKTTRKLRMIALAATLALSIPFGLAACGDKKPSTEKIPEAKTSQAAQAGEKDGQKTVAVEKLAPSEESAEPTNYVRMDMKDGGSIVIELMPDGAPITVANFQKLVKEKFYDGLTFHRAVPGFVIQGGDPKGDGTGGSKETIKGEFLNNGVFNPIKHKRGVISMARSNDMNSASSQFFIVLDSKAGSALNDKYAAFGRVIYGMDEVDRIAALPTIQETIQDKPVIEKAYFITKASAEAAEKLAKDTDAPAPVETKK